MAVALDSVTIGAQWAVESSAKTWSHVVGGANRFLLVGVPMRASVIGTNPTVTFNGVAATLVAGSPVIINAQQVWLYGLVAPATGSLTVSVDPNTITWTGRAFSISFTGVDQSSPYADIQTDSVAGASSPQNISLTTPSGGCGVLAGFVQINATGVAHTGGATEIVNELDAFAAFGYSLGSYLQNASQLGWSWTGTGDYNAIAVALAPAAATSVPLSGVGATAAYGLLGVTGNRGQEFLPQYTSGGSAIYDDQELEQHDTGQVVGTAHVTAVTSVFIYDKGSDIDLIGGALVTGQGTTGTLVAVGVVAAAPAPMTMRGLSTNITSNQTLISCGVGLMTMVGLDAATSAGISVNASAGRALAEGLPVTIIATTDVFINVPGRVLMEGRNANFFFTTVIIPIDVAISFAGSSDKIPVFDVGDGIVVRASFSNAATGDVVDPEGPQLRIRNPLGAIVIATPSRTDAGVYEYEIAANVPGTWRFTWLGTSVSEDGEFVVVTSLSDLL